MPADYDELVSRLNKIEFLLSQLGGALTSTGDVNLLNGTVSHPTDPTRLQDILSAYGGLLTGALHKPTCPALCFATDENVRDFIEARESADE